MAGTEDGQAAPDVQAQEAKLASKYGGRLPKKPPLISKEGERTYFDSADWALAKEGEAPQVPKPKSPLDALKKGTPKNRIEALRPKLEPTPHPKNHRRSSLTEVKTATGNDPDVKKDLGDEKEPAADDEEPAVQAL
eukprot:TRINITY_DN111_c0_g1_i1.p1 TRINITY_DN111_c0_g1~~TRINITY_DN111_c0_g1_i1.p1  ORF type:complete len:136 (+),score=23.16 TRINITY_DN111_c0_g1_i1:253-660(+)